MSKDTAEISKTVTDITGNGSLATCTVSEACHEFRVGDIVAIPSGASPYNGNKTITATPTDKTFKFASSETDTISGASHTSTVDSRSPLGGQGDAGIDDLAVWTDTVSSDGWVDILFQGLRDNNGLNWNNQTVDTLKPTNLYSWHTMGDGLENGNLGGSASTIYNMSTVTGHGRAGVQDRDLNTVFTPSTYGPELASADWATGR